jgi:rhodanese-related sulfurtransferase
VRECPEFAAGRIREARLIRLGEIERRAEEINRDVPVYVICRSGRRSAIAQQKLQALGFKEVYNVAEGCSTGRPVGFRSCAMSEPRGRLSGRCGSWPGFSFSSAFF